MVLKEKGKSELLEKFNTRQNLRIFLCKAERTKGLGHAISSARQFIGDEPFAVLLGDDIVESEVPAVKQLIDVYEETGHSVIGVQEVPEADTHRYGIIDPLTKTDVNMK